MPINAEKICDMRTLLKYAKNAAACEICGNRIYVGLRRIDVTESGHNMFAILRV